MSRNEELEEVRLPEATNEELEKNVEMGATLANLFTTKVNTTAN
jgi:hypothetical protein